jgi:curli biogenesis system outer membrane secretion channel CsgG
VTLKSIAPVSVLACVLALAQDKPATTPAPAQHKAAAPKPASQVDTVIQLVKGGMSESLIIKTLQRQNKPANLTSDDMLKLQKAGVSENIIGVLMDPASAPAPVAAAAATPASGPSASTPPPTPPPPPPLDPMPAAAAGQQCSAPAAVSAAPGIQKRRLAVEAFDYSAVKTNVTAIFNNDVNVGQGIRAILNAKMGQSKTVVLLEREKLSSLIKEQDMGSTNRFKQGTKAKIGQLTGADALLLGDIVIFGRDDVRKGNGVGGVAGMIPGPLGVIGGGMSRARKTDKAVVAINLRLVDAETGEVMETAEARGESTRTSTDWRAVAGTWRGGAGADSSMTSSNFQDTIIGEATVAAVAKIVTFIDQKIPALSAKSRTIEGRVANFDGCTLYLSVGGNDGVHVGDRFEIHQILKEVFDPETKEVLDKQTVKVGDFVVSTVRDKVSIGQYGGQPLSASYTKGYAARLVMQ